MKLSEAILEGCKITKPAKGVFVDTNFNDEICACVWGAAYVGKKGIVDELTLRDVISALPEEDDEIIWNNGIYSLRDLLILWNDVYDINREVIAERLREVWY